MVQSTLSEGASALSPVAIREAGYFNVRSATMNLWFGDRVLGPQPEK